MFNKIYAKLSNLLGFYYRLSKLLFASTYGGGKRILGIWDYKTLPWSVGDPLVFVEMLSVMKMKFEAEEVDMCIIYDSDDPAGNRKEPNITTNNAAEYMLEFLPLFGTCPFLGSIYQFKSRDEFYRFLKTNIKRYDVFPPLNDHLKESYNFCGGEPHLPEIQEFFRSNGHIPYLRVSDRDISWARWFYVNNLPEKTVPITLSLRRLGNPHHERNANPAVWLAFIDKCKIVFPEVKFVVVGIREEVFEGLRERKNVIIAKDHGTSLIEDMALIRSSIMYLAPASGINAIALFSDLPYLIFQNPDVQKYGLKSGENFSFSTNLQKTFGTDVIVTPELLFDEFSKLYTQINKEKWLNMTFKKAKNKNGLPSISVIEEK